MILVIGGSGSGKSAYAEKVALECQKEKRHFYLATMHVFGEEGQKKVERHKRMRAGKGFVTIEQPTDIMQCLPALREAGGGVVLLECMSNLAANEMFDTEEPAGSEQVAEKIVTQIGVLAQETEELVIVTNNVFEDGIVYDTSTMEYLRALGSINVRLAERSDVVVEVIAGIPVARKGKLPVAVAEKQGHRQKGAPGMSVIKSFFIAFSIYSKIPVPQFAWKEEDMQLYAVLLPVGRSGDRIVFPVVEPIRRACMGSPSTARAAVGAVLPLAISGGFHADGFMDTMDALHSYRDRERKLEILKDSHIGAFAVICFVMYELIYLGAVSMITEKEQILVLAAGFFLSAHLKRDRCRIPALCQDERDALSVRERGAPAGGANGAVSAACTLRRADACRIGENRRSCVCGSRAYLRVLQTEELPRIWRYYRRSRGVFCDAVRGCDGGACGGGRADRLGMKHCGMTHQKG